MCSSDLAPPSSTVVQPALGRTLRALARPQLVLVQNPPQFPTMIVTWWTLRGRGVRALLGRGG